MQRVESLLHGLQGLFCLRKPALQCLPLITERRERIGLFLVRRIDLLRFGFERSLLTLGFQEFPFAPLGAFGELSHGWALPESSAFKASRCASTARNCSSRDAREFCVVGVVRDVARREDLSLNRNPRPKPQRRTAAIPKTWTMVRLRQGTAFRIFSLTLTGGSSASPGSLSLASNLSRS
jgi:hypothetical protein